MKSKHTPGPWKAYQSGYENPNFEEFRASFWVGFGETKAIGPAELTGVVHPSNHSGPIPSDKIEKQKWFKARYDEAKANAHLIAAAPEMLSFLEKLALNADAPEDNALAKELFALIAKAKGEMP